MNMDLDRIAIDASQRQVEGNVYGGSQFSFTNDGIMIDKNVSKQYGNQLNMIQEDQSLDSGSEESEDESVRKNF